MASSSFFAKFIASIVISYIQASYLPDYPHPTTCATIDCKPDMICKMYNGVPECVPGSDCNFACTLELSPVCGSDGKTYSNACALKHAACESKKEITVASDGDCPQGCEAVTCMSPKVCREIDGHGVCECPLGCPKNLKPVCGSDGVTYDNKCLLNVKACETNSKITVVSKGPCPIGCATIRCLPPRLCEEINGHGKCVCPSACPAIFEPVCGSDGKTYSNQCFLGIAACKNKKDISVVSQGPCPQPTQAPNCDPIICASPNTCNHIDGQYKCICSRFCTLEFAPVCGSDGKTYPNECGLRVAACNSSTRITIENEGPCEPPKITCANVLCSIHTKCKMINDKPVCISTCPKFCLEIYSPVCGSDGVTYDNECGLKRAACKKGIIITVVHKGPCANPCDLSTSCRSHPYSTCRPVDGKPKCFCNRACPRIFLPVCGSDGKTYRNACKMKASSCKKNKKITVQRKGKCISAYYKAG